MMTSSFARRRVSSFTIARLIGIDAEEDAVADAGNHDDDDVTSRPLGVAVESDCRDVRQAASWQHRQPNTGAFHVYRPTSTTDGNFYEACLNWMRSRGTTCISIAIAYYTA